MYLFLHILSYRRRALRRWLKAHAFEIFFLGPVLVGGALWVLDRQLGHLRGPLAGALEAGSVGGIGGLSLGLVVLLTVLGLPATFRELYEPRRPSAFLETLPIPESVSFHVTLISELVRALVTCGVLLVASSALAGEFLPSAAVFGERLVRLMATLGTLVMVRIILVVLGVRLRRLGSWSLALGAIALLALVVVGFSGSTLTSRLALLPVLVAAAQLQDVFTEATGSTAFSIGWSTFGAWAATATALYLVAGGLFLSWHRRDLETGARLATPRRRGRPRTITTRLRSRLPRPLLAQISRDLLLVGRRFSPAVSLAFGFAVLLDLAVLTVLGDLSLPDLWRQRIAVFGLTLSVLAVVSLVPFLLAHQLPRFWIEKSTGVRLERIWEAKLWTAACLAVFPFLVGVAILATSPGVAPDARGTSILQLMATTWILTSILGLAVFEIAEQPLLGLIFGTLVGMALASLFVFYPRAWWLWAVFYVWVASQVAGRATRRVQLMRAEA